MQPHFPYSPIEPYQPEPLLETEPPAQTNDVKDRSFCEKILKGLGKFADAVHRTGITLTGILPFSSRGILLNLALAPIYIPIRLIQSAISDSKFIDKMSEYMDRDWNQGIQDFYIDLECRENAELREQVVNQNFRYAAYMYSDLFNNDGRENGQLLSLAAIATRPPEGLPDLSQFIEKIEKMGYKVKRNTFYNTKTGNMFNLIFNDDKKELAICFMGLGNEQSLFITDKDRDDLGSENKAAAAIDWIGGIPAATLEAIKIGKHLKKAAKSGDLTPVLVGHSHGGGMAQAGAVANGIKGIAFNSRPMGAGVRRYIGESKVAKNAKHVTTFSGRGDWLSGTVVVNVLAVLFERLTGIPVPRSVGTGYHLPELEGRDLLANHCGFYDSFEILKAMPNQ